MRVEPASETAAAVWTTSITSIMTEVAAVSQQPMLQAILELYEPAAVLHDAALLLLRAATATPSGQRQLQKQAGLPTEVWGLLSHAVELWWIL